MKKIVIITGSELRHTFMRTAIANASGIRVLRSYCESKKDSLTERIQRKTNHTIELNHALARTQSEQDFFQTYLQDTPDDSNPIHIDKGAINSPDITRAIIDLQPELIVLYGCSIIKAPLLNAFPNAVLNVHLGLSPYYRGSGTNFWALVNNEPEYFGATFMYVDTGIDTGEIIHQIRARVCPGDTPHAIGNRLIQDVAAIYPELIRRFDQLGHMPQPQATASSKFYRRKDADQFATQRLYHNFSAGLVDQYLQSQQQRCKAIPLVENPAITVGCAL